MRKHDVRKWLHAILDLLPVILIPVFMIYSHRHDVTERTDVEVTYKYQSNEVNTLDDLVPNHIYECDKLMFADDLNINYQAFTMQVHYIGGISVNVMDSTYVELTSIQELNSTLAVYDNDYGQGFYYLNLYLDYDIENSSIGQWYYYLQTFHIIFSFEDNLQITEFKKFYNATLDVYSSNEITMPHYTDYNVIESVEINDTKSSVMNVFMDDFNNSIDKYFNMGNVFNLNGVYQWFNTNIFSGNAPTVIYSIWNIALYELCMDLLFLLYGLFMWFIDMVQTLMDKPFKSIK